MNRAWPYSLFAAAILGVSIFIERPFCKYICPLARRCHAQHVPLVWPQAQDELQQLQGLRRGLWRPGH